MPRATLTDEDRAVRWTVWLGSLRQPGSLRLYELAARHMSVHMLADGCDGNLIPRTRPIRQRTISPVSELRAANLTYESRACR
jgi:hypothetical protein